MPVRAIWLEAHGRCPPNHRGLRASLEERRCGCGCLMDGRQRRIDRRRAMQSRRSTTCVHQFADAGDEFARPRASIPVRSRAAGAPRVLWKPFSATTRPEITTVVTSVALADSMS